MRACCLVGPASSGHLFLSVGLALHNSVFLGFFSFFLRLSIPSLVALQRRRLVARKDAAAASGLFIKVKGSTIRVTLHAKWTRLCYVA